MTQRDAKVALGAGTSNGYPVAISAPGSASSAVTSTSMVPGWYQQSSSVNRNSGQCGAAVATAARWLWIFWLLSVARPAMMTSALRLLLRSSSTHSRVATAKAGSAGDSTANRKCTAPGYAVRSCERTLCSLCALAPVMGSTTQTPGSGPEGRAAPRLATRSRREAAQHHARLTAARMPLPWHVPRASVKPLVSHTAYQRLAEPHTTREVSNSPARAPRRAAWRSHRGCALEQQLRCEGRRHALRPGDLCGMTGPGGGSVHHHVPATLL